MASAGPVDIGRLTLALTLTLAQSSQSGSASRRA
jgi:hypothetical protein